MDHSCHQKLYVLKCRFDFQVSNSSRETCHLSSLSHYSSDQNKVPRRLKVKVKSCYNPLRLGIVIVLISSGIDFVNTPRLYSDRATR